MNAAAAVRLAPWAVATALVAATASVTLQLRLRRLGLQGWMTAATAGAAAAGLTVLLAELATGAPAAPAVAGALLALPLGVLMGLLVHWRLPSPAPAAAGRWTAPALYSLAGLVLLAAVAVLALSAPQTQVQVNNRSSREVSRVDLAYCGRVTAIERIAPGQTRRFALELEGECALSAEVRFADGGEWDSGEEVYLDSRFRPLVSLEVSERVVELVVDFRSD